MSIVFWTAKLHHTQFILLVFTGFVMLAGLLSEKLIVADFTKFHLSSLSDYINKIIGDAEALIAKPQKELLTRDLIGGVLVIIIVIVHFLYAMDMTNSLYTSGIASIFFSVPVFYISFLVSVAFSPRVTVMPMTSLPKQ